MNHRPRQLSVTPIILSMAILSQVLGVYLSLYTHEFYFSHFTDEETKAHGGYHLPKAAQVGSLYSTQAVCWLKLHML